ncbi:hypothetical protein AAFF_G00149800 [Aldrovandia affinis]|uniref:Uncharacterized protein n=1 Tax=Aldrovandia affinis TaxID=143900 RepID=A0AAD7RRV0_9TELE|nr:hypothetical protein AAFF_G00149800 [Aldrovandia affinis]
MSAARGTSSWVAAFLRRRSAFEAGRRRQPSPVQTRCFSAGTGVLARLLVFGVIVSDGKELPAPTRCFEARRAVIGRGADRHDASCCLSLNTPWAARL